MEKGEHSKQGTFIESLMERYIQEARSQSGKKKDRICKKRITDYYFKALGIYIGSKENPLKELKQNSLRIKSFLYIK